ACREACPHRQRGEESEERPVPSREYDPPARQQRSTGERGERDRAESRRSREVAARRDADDRDHESGREPREQADREARALTPPSCRKRRSPHAATVYRRPDPYRTISTGVPSGMMRASRRIVGFVVRMQPWLTSWPIAAASFVPCRPIRPSPPKPNVL